MATHMTAISFSMDRVGPSHVYSLFAGIWKFMTKDTVAAHKRPSMRLYALIENGRVRRTGPLSGVKRTSLFAAHKSAFDPKRTL
jgi:hypothetical protein